MKLKNLILALKDQGPFTRFVKNSLKGHILGLFSKRSHFNQNGSEKIKYNTKQTTIKSAEKNETKTRKMV